MVSPAADDDFATVRDTIQRYSNTCAIRVTIKPANAATRNMPGQSMRVTASPHYFYGARAV